MKKLVNIFAILLMSVQLFAQYPTMTTTTGTVSCTSPCTTINASVSSTINATNTYSVTAIPYAPNSYTSGTSISTFTDDVYTNTIALPFTFCFFGNTYNQVLVGSNGNICFNTTLVGAADPWTISGPLPGSSSTATQNAIMFPWHDIYPPGGGTIKYQTYGTAPNRKFVVSFNNCTMFLPGTYCTGITATQQVVLYETTNYIDIFFNSVTACPAWNSGRAITGIENNAGTVFYTAPGENGTAWSSGNEGWRFVPTGAPITWSYIWSGPSGIVSTSVDAVVCPTITANFTCTATSTSCPSNIILTSVSTVTALPAVVPIIGPYTVCSGNTITLSDATSGGTWTSSNGNVTVSTSGVVTGVSNGTSIITYSLGSACSDTQLITVYPLYNFELYDTICNGNTFMFAGNVYSVTGTYSHVFTSIHGCDSTVSLNLLVNPTYNKLIDTTICQGNSVIFAGNTYSVTGTYTHNFTTVHFCDSSVTLNLTVNPTYHHFSDTAICTSDSFKFGGITISDSGTYSNTFSTINGCDSISTITVTTFPIPTAEVYINPYICINDTTRVELTYRSNDITSYIWNFPGASIVSTSYGGPYMIVYNLSGTFTVSVTVSNSLCSSTATDTVLVSGYPVANIQPLIIQNDKGRVCIGDSILFRATVSAENDIYIWNPMQWFEYRNVSWAYGVVNEPGFVYLLVSNEFGCKSYDSVYIDAKPCCTITFPSAFTPNRDGQNDLFRPIGSHYKIHNLEIQNRWGQTIYSSSSNNPEWDGTFLGIPCDIGTYFYFVYYDCNGVQLSQKGDISLIR